MTNPDYDPHSYGMVRLDAQADPIEEPARSVRSDKTDAPEDLLFAVEPPLTAVTPQTAPAGNRAQGQGAEADGWEPLTEAAPTLGQNWSQSVDGVLPGLENPKASGPARGRKEGKQPTKSGAAQNAKETPKAAPGQPAEAARSASGALSGPTVAARLTQVGAVAPGAASTGGRAAAARLSEIAASSPWAPIAKSHRQPSRQLVRMLRGGMAGIVVPGGLLVCGVGLGLYVLLALQAVLMAALVFALGVIGAVFSFVLIHR